MKINPWSYLFPLALSISMMPGLSAQGAETPVNPGYHFLKEIPIGGDGGWDQLQLDENARRLYVTHDNKLVVVDADTDKVTGDITNTPGVHDFAPVSEYHLGFSSNGQEGKLSMVNLKTLRTKSRIKAGQNPDAIVYDPGSEQLYAFNHGDNSVTILEGDDGDPVTTTALPGKPEAATVDSKAGRIFCNLEDKNAVAVIDGISHRVINAWPVAPGEKPVGMALDAAHHRLFIGCRGSKTLLVMNSTVGQIIASVPIGDGVDACVFDPGTQLAFSANGEGNVTIVHEDSPEKITVVQTLETQPGARTMALDPKTHKIYLPVAAFEPAAKPDGDAADQHLKIVPGSFRVLVYGM